VLVCITLCVLGSSILAVCAWCITRACIGAHDGRAYSCDTFFLYESVTSRGLSLPRRSRVAPASPRRSRRHHGDVGPQRRSACSCGGWDTNEQFFIGAQSRDCSLFGGGRDDSPYIVAWPTCNRGSRSTAVCERRRMCTCSGIHDGQ
jgi:hypothetical protein